MDEELRTVINKWLTIAEDDLKSADSILKAEPPITHNVCFHAQQCAEKCLKAYLVLQNHHVEKTHNLLRILKYCVQYDESFQELYQNAKELTRYAVGTRYPDDWREIPVEEAQEAIEKAEEVMTFVEKKLTACL